MNNVIDLRTEYFNQALTWGRSAKELAKSPGEVDYCLKKFKTSIVKSTGGTAHYVSVSGGVWTLRMAHAFTTGMEIAN